MCCDTCLPLSAKRASEKGVAVQQQLRAIGADRRMSPEVRATHAQHAKEQHRLNSAWGAKQTTIPSPAVYRDEIAPFLEEFSAKAVATATGLSHSSAKTILSERMTPHPRHWNALRTMLTKR